MQPKRYYFINREAKIVKHYGAMPEATPEGFDYCGMSQLQPKGAAGYYAKNQEGYSIKDGDGEMTQETSTHESQGNDIPAT